MHLLTATHVAKPIYTLHSSNYICAVHKAQDATLHKVVASFLKRPCAPSRNDFFAVYELLSRIR
jgi:hypothetical protein